MRHGSPPSVDSRLCRLPSTKHRQNRPTHVLRYLSSCPSTLLAPLSSALRLSPAWSTHLQLAPLRTSRPFLMIPVVFPSHGFRHPVLGPPLSSPLVASPHAHNAGIGLRLFDIFRRFTLQRFLHDRTPPTAWFRVNELASGLQHTTCPAHDFYYLLSATLVLLALPFYAPRLLPGRSTRFQLATQ